MRKTKYPDTVYQNFGIWNGELFSGDLTQSGKRVGIPNVDRLNSKVSSSVRSVGELVPVVEGPVGYSSVAYTPDANNKSVSTMRGTSLKPFKSTMGITAGKSYFPTGAASLIDEYGKVALSFTGTTGLTDSDPGISGPGPINILFESASYFYVLGRLQLHLSSKHDVFLYRVDKVNASHSPASPAVVGGNVDIEYLGIGVDGCHRLLVNTGYNIVVSAISGIAAGTSSTTAQRRLFVVKETAPNSGAFTTPSGMWLSYDTTAAASEVTDFYVSLSNCAREYDEEGRITGCALLANQNLSNSSGTSEFKPYLRWVKIALTDTGYTTSFDKIDFPDRMTIVASAVANRAMFQCNQWTNNGKMYAVVSPGRQAVQTSAPLPIMIMESELDGLELKNLSFSFIECAYGDYFTAFIDQEYNAIWWLGDNVTNGSDTHLRYVNAETKQLDYAFVSEVFCSLGCHQGQMLLVTQAPGAVNKWVLTPNTHHVKVEAVLDKIMYEKGERGTLTVSHDGPQNLTGTVQLVGGLFLDGTTNMTISLKAGVPLELPVTVQAAITATLHGIGVEYTEEAQ